MRRTAAKVDDNQPEIVKALRAIPGVTVDLGHDDFLVGHQGNTYWIELKHPSTISKRTGKVKPSEITLTERNRQMYWTGHYCICTTLDEILEEIGIG